MAQNSKYEVFISYRRSDSAERALLVRSYLAEWFQSDTIFLDTHEIHEGPFPDQIRQAINEAKYFVVLISKNSFPGAAAPGTTDYYAEEIKLAITNARSRGLKIIPILYDDVTIEEVNLPESLEYLQTTNCISYHKDDPAGFKNRLYEFTRKKNLRIKDWLVFPLAIITIYTIVSLISGIILYLFDRYATDYDEAVQIASQHVVENDGKFYYNLSDEFICYNPVTRQISSFPKHSQEGLELHINTDDLYKVGFWSTAAALAYQVTKIKYKPHGGKQAAIYVCVGVSMVAGVGLGCTLERMFFPLYRCEEIQRNIHSPKFWQDVIVRKYQFNQTKLIR